MSGRHSFDKLRKDIERDPDRRKRMEEKRKGYDALLNLAELRKSRGVTQIELARALDVSQPNVSKIEAAVEGIKAASGSGSGKSEAGAVQLSTLARYIAALGGQLEVRVTFPEHPEDNVAVSVPVSEAIPEDIAEVMSKKD